MRASENMGRVRALGVVVVAAMGCAAPGCTEGQLVVTSRVESSVGRVDGTDAILAVASDGSTITAYVCGGPTTNATFSRWFHSPAGASFAADQDGWHIEGELGASASGVLLDPAGNRFAWRTLAASPGTSLGLYRASGPSGDGVVGAIVGPVEAASGPLPVQGAWIDARGQRWQVTPLRPLEPEQDLRSGFGVQVVSATRSGSFWMNPFQLAN